VEQPAAGVDEQERMRGQLRGLPLHLRDRSTRRVQRQDFTALRADLGLGHAHTLNPSEQNG
jgi:hypothetical protein